MERAIPDRPPALVERRSRWRMMPERGTISLLELSLLAVCTALVALPLKNTDYPLGGTGGNDLRLYIPYVNQLGAHAAYVDAFYRGLDGVCYTYKLFASSGSWSVRDNQLCVDVRWETGAKNACRYVTILLDDIALFEATGKIDGKGMKLLKGKALAP